MPSYVVSGASRGMGVEFVRQLAQDPANTVFGLVRNPSGAPKLQELKNEKSNVHILKADINDYSTLTKAAEQVSSITGGSLDVLINNAAYIEFSNMHLNLDGYDDQDVIAQELRSNFETNCIGTIQAINAFLPLLKNGSIKKVATISSAVADLELTRVAGLSLIAPYSISKAAINLATAKYAAQYEKDGFIFFSTSPGPTSGDGGDWQLGPEQMKAFGEMFAAYRRLQPEWDGKINTAEESAKRLLLVIANVTTRDNGDFISQYGNKKWL